MHLKIRQIRKARRWTLDHLSGLTNLSVSFLSQLETGARQPSTETLAQIAAAFDVPVTALIDAQEIGDDLPELIDGMAKLNPDQRAAVMTLLRTLRGQTASK